MKREPGLRKAMNEDSPGVDIRPDVKFGEIPMKHAYDPKCNCECCAFYKETVKNKVFEQAKTMRFGADQSKGHMLKTWPEQFEALWIGIKRFEFRNDDRDFRIGDRLLLQEWDPMIEQRSGREITCLISYLVKGPDFGVPVGYAVLSLKNLVRWSGNAED